MTNYPMSNWSLVRLSQMKFWKLLVFGIWLG